jgi:DNA-binding MurR/RpiR family transcriptional regulator
MDVLDLMETRLSSFTKTDRAVYERLRKYPDEFAHESYDRLTSTLDVSPSALTRFAKKLGFAGYAELQYQLALDLEQRAQHGKQETVAEIFGSFLVQAERTLDRDALHDLAEHIVSARKVHCLGFNASSFAARFLWHSLRAIVAIDAENNDFDFADVIYHDDEVMVVFSVASGEWYRPMLQRIRKRDEAHQPYIALITMNSKHSLRRLCDSVILLPTAGKVSAHHTAALESMLFTLFNDMLIAELDSLKSQD